MALAPSHQAGWWQVFTFRSYFIFSPRVRLSSELSFFTIPILGLLGLSWPNYPNLGLTVGYWSNCIVLNDAQAYSVAQLDMYPYDSISHIFIFILIMVTSFHYTPIICNPARARNQILCLHLHLWYWHLRKFQNHSKNHFFIMVSPVKSLFCRRGRHHWHQHVRTAPPL